MFRLAVVPVLVAAALNGAQLISSTYLRPSFTPVAMATDATGNIYIAGNIVLDPLTKRQGVLVVKLNPQGAGYLYETYINGSTGELAGGIAIDSTGNAYVAGTTTSADFPLTPGGALVSAPTGPDDSRPFLTKLSPNGLVTLSTIFGGQGGASTLAIASDGNILVSGTSGQKGFPSTPGAYSVSDTMSSPFLIKLDPTTPKILFSATGIGGTSIALDAAGDIFVSGLTQFMYGIQSQPPYPTTPGAYQTQFPGNSSCVIPCQLTFPAPSQYVTKIDPTGSKLLYSTGINSPHGDAVEFGAGNPNVVVMSNAGLAVDAEGNAYVTGVTMYPDYPFTTPPPADLIPVPFLSKIDPTGSKLLFSVPAGGAGLQFDGAGNLDAAGLLYGPILTASKAAIAMVGLPSNFPSQCLPNNITSTSEGYLQQLDPVTGAVQAVQFIDGSIVNSTLIAVGSNRNVWISGATSFPDIPLLPNPLLPAGIGPGPQPGAFLASVSFSQSTSTIPELDCVLDAADMSHVGPVAPNQLLTLMGTNLGPAKGVSAPAAGSTSLAGVAVTFDDVPAKLLYISSSQINVAVPALDPFVSSSAMRIKVNGAASAVRLFPVTSSNPALFADLFATSAGCMQGNPPPALVRNADGSINSCKDPAKPESIVSLYVNGVGVGTSLFSGYFVIFDWDVVVNGLSAEVVDVSKENDWVTRVDVRLPAGFVPDFVTAAGVTMRESGLPVGPLSLTPYLPQDLPAGTSLPLSIWVQP
jgi:uncharacterized protein (TIGR03437 family)